MAHSRVRATPRAQRAARHSVVPRHRPPPSRARRCRPGRRAPRRRRRRCRGAARGPARPGPGDGPWQSPAPGPPQDPDRSARLCDPRSPRRATASAVGSEHANRRYSGPSCPPLQLGIQADPAGRRAVSPTRRAGPGPFRERGVLRELLSELGLPRFVNAIDLSCRTTKAGEIGDAGVWEESFQGDGVEAPVWCVHGLRSRITSFRGKARSTPDLESWL